MKSRIIAIVLLSLTLSACTYYQTAPGVYSSVAVPSVSKFEQAWSASIGAFSDQNIHITLEDRNAGVIQGYYNNTDVSGNITHQANGDVRVQFDTSNDPALINRITQSYNRRMGR